MPLALSSRAKRGICTWIVCTLLATTATAQPAANPTRLVRETPDSTFWPEAVDFDPRTRSYFTGSVRTGAILRIDSVGRGSVFWRPAASERAGAAMGIRVDAGRRVLWATTSAFPERGDFQPGDSAVAALLEIGLDDGRIRRRFNLPAAPGSRVLGDLVIGPGGDIFVSDSRQPELYRLRPGRDSLERIRDTLFKSLQGIAATPDGSVLYLADYSRGLLRLDLRTSEVTRVVDTASRSLRGADGLVWYRGSLVAIHNGALPGHVARIELDATGRAIAHVELIEIDPAIADEPTVGTLIGDELIFVGSSQWEKHDGLGRLKPGAKLRGIVIAAMKLR
jgi:hypothetical protein